MKLTYESTLDDLTDPSVRFFMRSETYRRGRIRNALVGALSGSAVGGLFGITRSDTIFATYAILGAVVGATISYLTTPGSTKRSIRKHLERETRGRLPALTVYTFEEKKVVVDHLGVTTAFQLEDIEDIAEDAGRLDISFGDVGLCTIPLRAFKDDEEKAAFLAKLSSQ